ncbi:hypothetical protein TNCV_2916191 [Trichonephila clavipes]|nr:hypothetical protein TNCV_2916191 [Trichonephila clavipes]
MESSMGMTNHHGIWDGKPRLYIVGENHDNSDEHDRAPAHFSIIMRNHLPATYPGRCIGRGELVVWPPRSLNLNPLDFFF